MRATVCVPRDALTRLLSINSRAACRVGKYGAKGWSEICLSECRVMLTLTARDLKTAHDFKTARDLNHTCQLVCSILPWYAQRTKIDAHGAWST